jgi:hypothetical protein
MQRHFGKVSHIRGEAQNTAISLVPDFRRHKRSQLLPAMWLSWELVENIRGTDEGSSIGFGCASWQRDLHINRLVLLVSR